MHEDLERALSFGSVADLYDRARPSYPDALVDDLIGFAPRDILDVGTGTGKAARLFLMRGCDVLGVEADARMAEVAREHGVVVEVSSFETWDAKARTFDLLISGQAWHWVDPAVGGPKAVSVLRPGGRLAAFWNLGVHEPAVRTALESVYRRLAPEIAETTNALGYRDGRDANRVEQLMSTGGFSSVELRSYAWDHTYTRDAWLAYLATHSDHVQLAGGRRSALLEGVGAAIDSLGGEMAHHYQTVLILATRQTGV
ncbi:MAG: class I SAM-dependent methyltransferase [Chloroflexi bacterium]|nr:MAG: class I SAM-dependent methyltransferase [Chloroflexota bacterium]